METLNITEIRDYIAEAADIALRLVEHDARWTRAINRAWEYLDFAPVVQYDVTTGEALLPSHSGDRLYRAGRACECAAYQHNNPCWHRAAARLIRRALELRDAYALVDDALAR